MIDLTKFEEFDFNEGVPYVSITSNGVTFNKSVIMKMDYPSYVRLLIDAENMQIAIQACNESTNKSVQFYKPKANGVLSIRWNAKDLINTLSRITGWNLKEQSFRVNGEFIPEQHVMLFDLSKATIMV